MWNSATKNVWYKIYLLHIGVYFPVTTTLLPPPVCRMVVVVVGRGTTICLFSFGQLCWCSQINTRGQEAKKNYRKVLSKFLINFLQKNLLVYEGYTQLPTPSSSRFWHGLFSKLILTGWPWQSNLLILQN